MTASRYRTRIYKSYVQAREQSLAPASLAELRSRAPYLRRLVRMHFPTETNAAVLDVGCGHGALIHIARTLGYHNIRGVDGSPEQVAAAQRLCIEGVMEGDLNDFLLDQSDASLDVVVAFDVIEHFTRDELLSFVDQVRRVLKPGGRWIIHTPNGESPFASRMRYWDLTHEMAFTRMSLSQLLMSSGFSNVRCFEDAPVVHGLKSAFRWLLWKGFRAVLRLYMGVETVDAGAAHIFSQNLLAVATR
jgi:2-polyprenyl-3-methyl-5-hydroxy-6-metoxy-1,4-benzoquinol methylase